MLTLLSFLTKAQKSHQKVHIFINKLIPFIKPINSKIPEIILMCTKTHSSPICCWNPLFQNLFNSLLPLTRRRDPPSKSETYFWLFFKDCNFIPIKISLTCLVCWVRVQKNSRDLLSSREAHQWQTMYYVAYVITLNNHFNNHSE